MSTEADIVERLARIIDPEAMAEYEAGFGRGGPTYDQLAVYPRVKSARLKASGLLPVIRAEHDAAARDMRERCAKAAETADRTGKRCLDLVKTMAGSEAMRRVIVEDIRGLSVIATEGMTDV